MSLAEPRKRRKNSMYSINLSEPNHWTNDDSKFGQKMLEKFGWKKGSGLGKNQQGISENIRVQQKISPTGLGFVAHNADDWFKAGEEYSRLLSQLTEELGQPTIPSKSDLNPKRSLVQNSLNSKSRVHYHKFTKGKDLTQYNKQELACILGKGIKNEENCTNSLDIKEYFKSKQKSKTVKNDTLCNTDSQTISDDESNKKGPNKTDIELTTDLHDINFIPLKKRKHESKLSKEIDIIPSNESNSVRKSKKSKTIQNDEHVTLCNTDSLTENNGIVFTEPDIQLKTDLHNINFIPPKQKKRESKLSKKINIVPFNESNNVEETKKKSENLIYDDVYEEEISINKNSKTLVIKDNLENYKSEYYNDNYKTEIKEQYSEMVLAQFVIDNSSAGKKYCKDSLIEQNQLFEKKIKEFADSAKRKTPTTVISTEIKLSDEESKSIKSKTLDPNDKNFIKDFELKKLEVLDSLSKHQQKYKYTNKMSMFIARHGDMLFFGSNLNHIKGYGEW